jgi:DNA-binding transcriptional MocR family regulator
MIAPARSMRSRRKNSADGSEPLYARLAGEMGKLINRGVWRPGDRLPSIRKASRQHRVSVTTAVQAYLALEDRGLIEARPKSGFFVRPYLRHVLSEPQTSQPSTRPAIGDSRTLLARVLETVSQPSFVQFGAGSPSLELMPVRKLIRTLTAAARRAGPAALEYQMPPGCEALRRALARRALDWGLRISPDEIITTTGCMEALVLSLRAVTRPGDTVAIESPTFFGIIQALEHLGLKALEIPTHPRTGLDLDELERIVRKQRVNACLVIPNFNNPVGSLMSDAAKERLVAILRRREIPLIEDDLLGDLHFGANRPRVAKAYDKAGLVMLCGSYSKTVAPGYRVGWMIPGRFFEKAKNLKFTNSVATSTLPQLALADYVTNGGYDHHLRSLRSALQDQVAQISHGVAESFPPETKLTRPAGGFVLWVELPRSVDTLRLQERAFAEKISIAPGPMFSPRQAFRNCLRLSCGEPWSPRVERAIGVLGYLAKQG